MASDSQEYALAESLVWSTQDFSLAEFVEKFELPQVVLVEVGYCGEDERTTFSSGQILTLHTLRRNSKIVCQVPHANAVTVPSSCQFKAEVIPMECYDTIVTAYQLSTQYQKIKFVRVMEIGSTWNNNAIDTLKINDILQIMKIDTRNSVIRCKNLTSDENVSILIDSTAVFIPLVDPMKYTLAEIKKKFRLPAKIRFLDKKAEIQAKAEPSITKGYKPTSYLSDLGQMTAIEEIEDSDVIVTTVCSNLKEKVCFNVPTTLDIRLTVAEGFLHGDETYQKVVKTLDKQLNRTDLEAFEGLDVYQHMHAVKEAIKQLDRNLPIEVASADVQSHANQQLQIQRKKSEKWSFLPEKKPEIVPRGQGSSFKKPPPIPPKKTEASNQPKESKIKLKKLKSPNWLNSLGRKISDNKSPAPKHEGYYEELGGEGAPYEQPEDGSDGCYASIEDLYEEGLSQDSDSDDSRNYTELNKDYVTQRDYVKPLKIPLNQPTKKHHYHEPEPTSTIPQHKSAPSTPKSRHAPKSIQDLALPEIPNERQSSTPPPLPSSKPPQTQEDKQAIYEAIARFPKDISGLSVADVSRLLRYLGMGSYVETFESELVDGDMLSSMDQDALESLNVSSFHVKKMLKFIGGWRPNV
ncbi:uncharacterized protein LOC114535088 [Dendronephthya gigantea]|uniref:uncharacterized protein LOC114535088 n=1 Tax=Dendronephthya gigantea TaxID=151771 RepID=UPI00106D0FAA|nr:uncharacterized protein LOC114535088 [Dendronephthya gigantea]